MIARYLRSVESFGPSFFSLFSMASLFCLSLSKLVSRSNSVHMILGNHSISGNSTSRDDMLNRTASFRRLSASFISFGYVLQEKRNGETGCWKPHFVSRPTVRGPPIADQEHEIVQVIFTLVLSFAKGDDKISKIPSLFGFQMSVLLKSNATPPTLLFTSTKIRDRERARKLRLAFFDYSYDPF